MTADNENTIRAIISNAKPVQDLLKELVQKTESDPGAPFEPENIELIAELRQNDLADYFRLRDLLKKRGVSVRALERAISGPRCVGLGAFGRGGAGTTADQTELLLRLAEEAELFHTPDRSPYADIQINGGRKTLEIADRGGLGDWLRERWFLETEGGVPCPESLKAALRTIAARAQYKGAQHEVHVRVAAHEGSYYLDLANDDGYVVQIDQQEWKVIRCSPVRFLRPPGMLSLPMPEHGGSLTKDLFPILNLRSESEQVLVTVWLVNCLIASPNYRVLVLQGEHGTAKSRITRTLRDLLDPQAGELQAPPHNDRDLLITAINSHVLAFDNVSKLSQEMSDTFCRVATGTTIALRRLYTDREEERLTAVKPIILNGIEHFVTREDLADRAISITLQPIPSKLRRTDGDLDRAFEERRAYILGALLDIAVHGLRSGRETEFKPLSRMADFDQLAIACETAVWPAGTYERALAENREELVDAGIEADLLATAVLKMTSELLRAVRAVETVESSNDHLWKGTATDLLRELEERNANVLRNREWPKNPRQLSGRLRRVAPLLRHKGIKIDFRGVEGHSNTRMIYITPYPSLFGEHVAPLAPLAHSSPRIDTPVCEEGESVDIDEEDKAIEMPPPPSPVPVLPDGTNTANAMISDAPPKKIVVKRPKKKTSEGQAPDQKTVAAGPPT